MSIIRCSSIKAFDGLMLGVLRTPGTIVLGVYCFIYLRKKYIKRHMTHHNRITSIDM